MEFWGGGREAQLCLVTVDFVVIKGGDLKVSLSLSVAVLGYLNTMAKVTINTTRVSAMFLPQGPQVEKVHWQYILEN